MSISNSKIEISLTDSTHVPFYNIKIVKSKLMGKIKKSVDSECIQKTVHSVNTALNKHVEMSPQRRLGRIFFRLLWKTVHTYNVCVDFKIAAIVDQFDDCSTVGPFFTHYATMVSIAART